MDNNDPTGVEPAKEVTHGASRKTRTTGQVALVIFAVAVIFNAVAAFGVGPGSSLTLIRQIVGALFVFAFLDWVYLRAKDFLREWDSK